MTRDHRPARTDAAQTRRTRLLRALPPAILIAAQLCLLGPVLIFATNPGEFTASSRDLVALWVLSAAVCAAVLAGLAAIAPRRGADVGVSTLLALGLCLWLQGNLLVSDYGLLDGRSIDFSTHAARGPLELALWLGMFATALVLRRFLASHALAICSVVLAAQLSGLLWTALTSPVAWSAKAPGAPPDEIYQFAAQRNALLIVLDAFQSDVFDEIVEADRERYDRSLAGFVFFADNAGAFPTTALSIPAMLSGALYENDVPMLEFALEKLREDSLARALSRSGWETDVISVIRQFVDPGADYTFQLSLAYVSAKTASRFTAAQLLDLSLFRHAPTLLKPAVYADRQWLLQRLVPDPELRFHATTGRRFVEDFVERMEVARNRPVFKMIHLGPPHPPVVVDSGCHYVGVVKTTRETYTEQARCALSLAERILDRLRALSIYDDALIVLASDHGLGLYPTRWSPGETAIHLPGLMAQALALLAVKPPGAQGPLRTSFHPTAIGDIPATVVHLLGLPGDFPGRSAFAPEAGTPRRRTYSTYRWRHEDWRARHLSALHRYGIDGPVLEGNSWRHLETVFAPGLTLEADRIDLGTPEARRHLGPTWGADERDPDTGTRFVRARGARSSVFLSLPPKRPIELVASLCSPYHRQSVSVLLDGVELGRWNLEPSAEFRDHVVQIPAVPERPPISELQFRFARRGLGGRNAGGRPLTVRFARLTLEGS